MPDSQSNSDPDPKPPAPSGGCWEGGLKVFLVLVAVLSLVFVGKAGYEDHQEKSSKNKAMSEMFRLAAFIQHHRKQSSVEALDAFKNEVRYKLGFDALTHGSKSIGCYEIPSAERKGQLKNMEFYLFDDQTEIGVLANGAVFEGKPGADIWAKLQADKALHIGPLPEKKEAAARPGEKR
ncbi:MAG TPA: hypothetical protein VGE29_05140 [Prosthecobacter sp.]